MSEKIITTADARATGQATQTAPWHYAILATAILLTPASAAAEALNTQDITTMAESSRLAPTFHNLLELELAERVLFHTSQPPGVMPHHGAITVTLPAEPLERQLPLVTYTPTTMAPHTASAKQPTAESTALSVDELHPRRLRAGTSAEFTLHGQGFTRQTDVSLTTANPDIDINSIQYIDSDTLKVTIAASENVQTRVFNFNVQDPKMGKDKLAPGLIVVHVPTNQ